MPRRHPKFSDLTSNGYVSRKDEYENFEKNKVCNETGIDCLFEQQQFCLTLEPLQ